MNDCFCLSNNLKACAAKIKRKPCNNLLLLDDPFISLIHSGILFEDQFFILWFRHISTLWRFFFCSNVLFCSCSKAHQLNKRNTIKLQEHALRYIIYIMQDIFALNILVQKKIIIKHDIRCRRRRRRGLNAAIILHTRRRSHFEKQTKKKLLFTRPYAIWFLDYILFSFCVLLKTARFTEMQSAAPCVLWEFWHITKPCGAHTKIY